MLLELSHLSDNRFYCRQTADAPQASLIVEQMRQCPYSGKLRYLSEAAGMVGCRNLAIFPAVPQNVTLQPERASQILI
ncbi:hypothetical protein [Paenibacillus elgii]|uniref:hypothetical protein n=1 Tax=Paenibacillus elgii TaxID=189691 RepID=UPI000FD95808|nr:hypothetical protein [Paenibacillus elgii]NEN85044.1 hypothetical protein [Paenibacillus elgii]